MGLCLAAVVHVITGSPDAAMEHITLQDLPDPDNIPRIISQGKVWGLPASIVQW